MSELDLQTLLREYARGEAGLDAVAAALDARLADAPTDAPGVLRQLESARGEALDEDAYARLRARVDAAIADARTDQGDKTRVLPGGTGGRAAPPSEGAPDDPTALPLDVVTDETTDFDPSAGDADESDKTRVLSGGTGGQVASPHSEESPAGAEDETLVRDVSPDDATEMRARPLSPDDATVVREPPEEAEEDTTEVRTAGGAETGADATVVQGAAEAEEDFVFDPTAPAGPDETLVHTQSPATGATAPTAATSGPASASAPDFTPGYVIKDRFRLVETLGEGGMGAVWKAVDKLKEEARDRNPFVAVKLLVGDFRDHPEAFIALQRESAKQQRLAHPNIATVYDFDRDGDTVYMTMEVMTGTPMDKFIRQLPAEGLPYEEAMPIIEELGAGLAYAHQADLVHSDLKPGNAFLTQDNHVKLLDFGIARASKTRTDAEGEKTLFDPGQLGALTPTYATIEMFEGMDPDPRDDIYAMAIIAYQLFTGKHPYGKKPAPKAKELGLVPEPVEKLTKRQNQALLRGLALEREDRTPSVEEFLEGLRPFKSKLPWIVGGSIAAALVIGVLAYKPVVEYVERQEREEIIEVFMQGGQENIDRGMGMVAELEDPAQREAIAADPRTRKAIIDLHVKRREEHFDPERERWDYAAAVEVMDELSSLYPDSAEVLTLRTELEREKNQVLGELASRYARLLEEGEVVPDPEGEDITDVREVVARVDPDNALLDDPRLGERYASVARESMEAGEWERAEEVLVAGRALVAETEELAGLRSRVEGELARIAEERRVAALEDRLEGRSFDSLGAYEEVRAELRELFALRPTHPLLEGAAPGLAEVLGEELARARDAGELEGARARLVAWAPVLGLERVHGYRAALTEAGAGAGSERELAERVERIEGLVAEPVFDARWEARVRAGYAELLALGGAGAEAVARMRERIASLYLERAQAAREAERFDDALALLERGGVFAPGRETFAAEREAVVAAREDKRRREAEARRLARIEQMKSTLRAHAEAGRVPEARAVLGELRAELPAGDAFLAREGPEAIARSSLRLARAAFERGEREAALAGVRAGLEVAPGHAGLEGAREEYRAAVVARALALQRRRARALAPSAAPEARAATRPAPALSGAGLAPPEAPAPRTSTAAPPRAERYPALGPALAATLAERVTARAREAIEEQEWRRAREVLVAGRALVAETEELAGLRSRVEGELARIAEERRVAALEDRLEGRSFDSLGAYEEVRAELRELFALRPTHPLLEGAAPGLAEVLGEELARARDAGELEGARARLVAWAPVLGLERVHGYREALTEAGAGAGGERELAERVERIEGLVAEPVFDARWEARVRAGYAELLALGGAGAEAVARMRERIASLYLERAQAAREAERFDDALALLERGGVFAPGRETFAAEREAVVAAREDKRRREAEARRLARIEQMKSTLRAHAEAGRVPEARAVLGELRAELPAGDAFLAREGPEAIARSSLRLARAAFERGEREAALAGVRAGLEVAPGHAGLEGAREEYRAAVVARALALQRRRARALAPSAAPEARAATRPAPALSGAGLAPPEPSPAADGAMSANGAHAPPLAGLDARVAARVAERIAAGAKGSPREVAALAGPAAGFRTLFPRRYDALAGDIEQTLAARLERMAKAKDVKGHNTLLAAAKRIPVLRGRADIEGPKPSKLLAELGLSQVEDGALGAALETASKVASEQPDATNLEEFRDTIAKRKSQAGEYYEKFERYAKAQRLRTAKQYLERALALWSDNPTYTASLAKLEETAAVRRGACVASLAGYGRRRRGTCHDEVAGAKGPAMVVVPAADGSSPFAIGKYEVTVADFNRYCKASGACQALPGDPGLPATGLSLEAMRAYASWLSEHTGATYRLPTEAEWEHAAKAGGKQPRKDFNCRVTQGGSVVKGHSLVSAESGSQNAWGLANYVGNAREVVTTSNGLATRGGAYTDSLVECDVGMRGTDLASPAQDTGFRLVREIG